MGVTELLTVAETAALLKTTKQQIRKTIKTGREWRVSKEYLNEFLRANMS